MSSIPLGGALSAVFPEGNTRSRSSNVDAAMASSIVEVESKIAPAGDVTRRGDSTSRRIGDGEGGQDIRGGSRCTLDPLGRFAAALTTRRSRLPRRYPVRSSSRNEPGNLSGEHRNEGLWRQVVAYALISSISFSAYHPHLRRSAGRRAAAKAARSRAMGCYIPWRG